MGDLEWLSDVVLNILGLYGRRNMRLTFKTEIVFRFCASRSQSPCLFWGVTLSGRVHALMVFQLSGAHGK